MWKNLSIRTSLTLMIAFFGVVLLLGAAAGLLALRASNASLQQMYTVDTPAVADLEGSAGQLLRLRLALATYASLADLSDQEGADAVLKRFDQYQKASNDRLAHYVSRASADADEQRLIKDMETKRDTFLHEGVEPALAALKSGDRNAFQQLQAHKLPSLYSAYEKSMLALEQWQLDHGAQRYQQAQDRFYAISIAVAVGIVVSLLGAWLGRVVLVRAIVSPVDATIAQFQQIANGDLTSRIDVTSNNEMGRLAAALRKMQE
jgi:methyl-accepting chemotaxis protein